MPIKNVILILTDQQHYRSLGCTDLSISRTPNIDYLAQCGVNFQRHIVTNPVCMPSRASIFTGLYINEHCVWNNGCRLSHVIPTIPGILSNAGIDCAHFGKLHLEPIINRVKKPYNYGFQCCKISEGDQQLTHDSYFSWLRENEPDIFLEYLNEIYSKGHDIGYCSRLPEYLHMTHFVTDQSIEWLTKQKKQNGNFFLSIGFFDPHHPFNPVQPYYDHFKDIEVLEPIYTEGEHDNRPEHYRLFFERKKHVTLDSEKIKSIIRAFHAMMEHIDTNVGRIIKTIKELDLDKETLIIFSSDHGEFLGNHGLLHKGAFMLDDLLHVPMIASIPDDVKRNLNCKEYTSSVDIMPTLCRIFGVDAPKNRGIPMLDSDMKMLPEGSRGFAVAQWEGEQCGIDLSLISLQNHKYKLVFYGDNSDYGELYDLQNDPKELINLYNIRSYEDVKREMVDFIKELQIPCRPSAVRECQW